jgi:hypothetical protein
MFCGYIFQIYFVHEIYSKINPYLGYTQEKFVCGPEGF